MKTEAFELKIVKNCRKYTKRCYQLHRTIDRELLSQLEVFGILQINEFSKFSPLAKDSFEIRLFDEMAVSGVLEGDIIYVVVARKAQHCLFDQVEEVMVDWFYQKEKVTQNSSLPDAADA